MTDVVTKEKKELPAEMVEHVQRLKSGALPNRSGRPKGALNKTTIETMKARELLETVGFNPIKKLIDQYEAVDAQIETMKRSAKPSNLVIANLENVKKGIAETLLKYAYKPITTAVEQSIEIRQPLKINLGGLDGT
jgi:hypothetical protein